MPQPKPSSCGSISQGLPVLSTNKIPFIAARSGNLGRPPFGLGAMDGRSGAILHQSSSVTRSLAILASHQLNHSVRWTTENRIS